VGLVISFTHIRKKIVSKIIFLDIDGPMIPVRAYFLAKPDSGTLSTFDPLASVMLNKLLEISGAKLVISSIKASSGYDEMVKLLEDNGISPSHMHEDWVTPRRMSSYRIHEICWWLEKHPEVTHYVAIDDENLDMSWVPCAVLCDAYEGFSLRNYLECCVHLDSYEDRNPDEVKDMISLLKRRELWRTQRNGEAGQQKVWDLSKDLFPLPTDK
jgi:hypothetical protein